MFSGSRLVMTGERAAIRWSYRLAADVGAWRIEDRMVQATLTHQNAFYLTQGPLWFTVDNSAAGRPPFERQLLDVAIVGDTLTGRLGPRKDG